MKKIAFILGILNILPVVCSESKQSESRSYSTGINASAPQHGERKKAVSNGLSSNSTDINTSLVESDERKKAYDERVAHYENNVFRRELTDKEKNLYCGHLLDK